MKFGERIVSSQHPPWSEQYIDYVRLKHLLYQLFEIESPDAPQVRLGDESANYNSIGEGGGGGSGGGSSNSVNGNGSLLVVENGDGTGSRNDHDAVSSPPRHAAGGMEDESMIPIGPLIITTSSEFRKELDLEIKKAVLFVLRTLGELAAESASLHKQQRLMSFAVARRRHPQHPQASTNETPGDEVGMVTSLDDVEAATRGMQQTLQEIYSLRMEYLTRVGSKLLLLLEFVELSIDGIRKIVKKHDKFLSKMESKQTKAHAASASRSRSIASGSQEHAHHSAATPRYERLRRRYLPRFAIYAAEPNLRCLFLIAADAGDITRSGDYYTQEDHKLGSQLDGSFGGWDVIHRNLEMALRELFQWESETKLRLRSFKTRGSSVDQLPRKEAVGGQLQLQLVNDLGQQDMVVAQIPNSLKRSISDDKNILSRAEETGEEKSQPAELNRGGIYGLISLTRSPFRSLARQTASPKLSKKPEKTQEDSSSKDPFFEPMLYRIESSRRRLGETTHRYISMVYANEMVHLIEDRREIEERVEEYLSLEGRDAGKRSLAQVPKVSRLSKFLNLASTALYMCNYNIVSPTSGMYAQLLGFDPANAGIIIGMTPVAVIASSVLYSWWSSYSYKRALLFASGCCVVGNIVYALALPCNRLSMVLIGRLLTGFGSARVINRRYIADYYSIENRTSGMADFVSASALGQAIGPGIAALLSLVAPEGRIGSDKWWTVETAPGYLMFVLWLAFYACKVLFFEEPARAPKLSSSMSKTKEKKKGGYGKNKTENGDSLSEVAPLVKPLPHSLSVEDPKDDGVTTSSQTISSCNIPVLTSLLLLVLLKCILEGLMSSAPTVSMYYFGWGVDDTGIFLASIASLMLPVNFAVAHISRKYDDRELIVVMLVMMSFGIFGFLTYGNAYSQTRFILFGFVMFVTSNALEGPTMSLLSKTIPKALAKGTLNAGLLATEAGTVGRVIGDFWLSGAAFLGAEKMLDLTFEPMGVMVIIMTIITFLVYAHLQPRYEDEDDDD